MIRKDPKTTFRSRAGSRLLVYVSLQSETHINKRLLKKDLDLNNDLKNDLKND